MVINFLPKIFVEVQQDFISMLPSGWIEYKLIFVTNEKTHKLKMLYKLSGGGQWKTCEASGFPLMDKLIAIRKKNGSEFLKDWNSLILQADESKVSVEFDVVGDDEIFGFK